jgi:predicted cupin superfamily sugar epimerase
LSDALTADEVIAHLGLKPHPEGGWFRETFRDETGPHGRAHSTAILFLLKAGEVSRWHKVDAAELWHWYGGAPLLLEAKHGETRHEYRLGPDWHKGDHPHAAVPAMPGRARAVLALGRSSVAPWRQASTSPASSLRPRATSNAFPLSRALAMSWGRPQPQA